MFRMKKLFAFIIFFSICGTCFAADTITAEIESNNIKSYCINNQGYSYFNCFVKYAAPTPEYWFRINLKFRDRLLPTINIVIDDKKYMLNAVEEYKKRHLKAGTGTEIDGNYNQEDFDCYIIPDDVVEKLKTCKSAYLILDSLHRYNMKLNFSTKFISNMKVVINSDN